MSFIVPTFDRTEQLCAALDRIAAQDPSIDVEVIVINDGGRSARAALQSDRPPLCVGLVESEQRKGPSAARNARVELARSAFSLMRRTSGSSRRFMTLRRRQSWAHPRDRLRHGDLGLVHSGAGAGPAHHCRAAP